MEHQIHPNGSSEFPAEQHGPTSLPTDIPLRDKYSQLPGAVAPGTYLITPRGTKVGSGQLCIKSSVGGSGNPAGAGESQPGVSAGISVWPHVLNIKQIFLTHGFNKTT